MAISKEQIFQVADELDAAGQNPTLAAVRKALDGGSYTTISEAMKEWRAAKAADATPIQEPPPAGVMEKLSEVGAEIWGIALELANGRFASEREDLEAARLEIEASRLEAVELADQLSAELDESRNQVVSLEGIAQDLRVEVDNLKGKLNTATERATTAEARSIEMDLRANDLRSELDRAHLEADKNRQALDRVQDAAAKAFMDHKAELAQVQADANQAAKEHLKEVDALREKHAKALEQARAAQTEVERLAAIITSLESQKAQSEEKLISSQEVAATAREEAAALRGRVEGLEIALSQGDKALSKNK